MDIFNIVLIVIGLAIFETVCSIDNAIINADILSTMKEWARRWFLTWGIIIAVFVVRGVFPWLVIWFSSPGLGPVGAFTATFSGDPAAAEAIELSAPYLLTAGGVFMFFLFLSWLMTEDKNCLIPGEKFITNHGESWFYPVSSVILLIIVAVVMQINPWMGLAAVVGSTVFYIMMGFRHFADRKTLELEKSCTIHPSKHADISKLLLLEVIDATFSVDGVIGAFAFTFSVPLILIGNGIGALVVRELTVRNIDNIRKFPYLKNGAMYSIMCLGFIMCFEAVGIEIPVWFTPVLTICIVGIFLFISVRAVKKAKQNAA